MNAASPLKIIFGSFLHAFVLLGLTFFWLSLPNVYSDEAFLVKWTSLIKKKVFNLDDKPNPDEVLFVDISSSKTTIPLLNEFEEYSNYHRKVITDRAHLTEFLALIQPYKETVQHIFLDILFEDQTAQDSLLQTQLNQLDGKILLAATINKKGKYTQPVFETANALTTYQTTQGMFLKFPVYFGDSLKTVPLVLYEKIHGAKFERKWNINWLNNIPSLPTPIVDFKVRPTDFRTATNLKEKNFAIQQLGTILELSMMMDSTDIAAYFENKIIIVGDFKNDIHPTIFGLMPGSLILYNAYLTLKAGAYKISWAWIIYMLLSFWGLSYVAFTRMRFKFISFFFKPQRAWVEDTLNETFILILITIGSYFLFNIHINILILMIYLAAATYLFEKVAKLKPK